MVFEVNRSSYRYWKGRSKAIYPDRARLEEAIERNGAPEIFNTDQGSQFTSEDFTGVLKSKVIAISMDGKRRWVDNVFVEGLWCSVKYEEVYLHPYRYQNRQGVTESLL
jgi:transposase InsO family protein